MRIPIRVAVGVGTVVVVLLGSTAAAAASVGDGTSRAAQIGPNGWRAHSVDWTACPDHPNEAGLRCATLDLPIDWDRPNGATFPLAITRRAAGDPRARIGPLVFGTGGPGLSGVDHVAKAGQHLSPEILRRFDVIGFDARGVARSNPAVCSSSLLAQQPLPVPADEAGYARWTAFSQRLYDDCRSRTGPLFDHLDTGSVARDVDAVRAALGERRISFYGVSYGTLLGQAYAERFPDRIRAMALDSVMDHSVGTTAFLRDQAASVEDSFDEFVAWCGRARSCALHGRDVGAGYDDLMRRAEAGTLVDPGRGTELSWFDLSGRTFRYLYGPDWPGLAGWLDVLDRSTPPPTGGASTTLGAGAALPGPATAKASGPSVTDETIQHPFPVFCQDWSLPVKGLAELTRYLDLSRAAAPHLRVAAGAIEPAMFCAGWDGEVHSPQHRLRVGTSVPLLLINSRHDPATPHRWAVNAAEQLGRKGRLVSYEGAGHGAYLRTPCTVGHVDRYLIDRRLPPVGAACGALAPPERPTAVDRDTLSVPAAGPTWSGTRP
ncbi:alpha/beta fold hydrolase [Plantactinospora sp. S1510]|uniref:Alpha/beta fold hydrolase n=1 Tax=Plantactinospora alkalitolerans TaxID=2789879 RepID=A0ABS0H3J8_9ACTN|nr:alpha/beta hydrolase [Plantactinospora alkalitolerans]MBF9132788.1 alpha/beta fold hydrolase [Plantactinospora alkalitolerans]